MTQRHIISILFKKNNNIAIRSPKFYMSTASKVNGEENVKYESTYKTDEVQKFSEQSKQWWDLNGPFKALHTMNSIRVPFIRDGLVFTSEDRRTLTPLKGKKILDVGCGGGILTEQLSKIGAEITGIDASKELIELAIHHSKNNHKLTNKPNYVCTTVEDHLKDHKEYYDAVVASEVIEHVDNKELFVKSCIAALKPNGRIFLTTPNRTQLNKIFSIYIAENFTNLVPKGTHQYEMLITPNELNFLLERNGCHVEAIYGMFYKIHSSKWVFSKIQSFMYAMQAIKLEPKKTN